MCLHDDTIPIRKTVSQERKIAESELAIYTYDIYSLVHYVFDACRSITREGRRGLSPGNQNFLGPVKWH
jgi:hypothetical protein